MKRRRPAMRAGGHMLFAVLAGGEQQASLPVPLLPFGFAILSTCCLVSCGSIGPDRYQLTGSVTFQGQPVPAGQIHFWPDTSQGNEGPGSFATITEGRYETAAAQGIVGGPHRVRIVGYQELPTTEAGGRQLFPEFEDVFELPAGGRFDFEVQADSNSIDSTKEGE